MLKEIVEVVEVLGNKIKIKFQRASACSCCQMQTVCEKGNEILLIDDCGFTLNVDDRIEIGINEKKALVSSVLTFLIPTIIFILTLLIFHNYGDAFSFFLALFALAIYYVIFKIFLRTRDYHFKVKILRKL